MREFESVVEALRGAAQDPSNSRYPFLGGQRSACVRGPFEERGVKGWLDMHATVKGGIMYTLAFTVLGDDMAPHEALLARIHDAFALPR